MRSKKYADKVKYLGLVPLEDVYTLNANCVALINPSFLKVGRQLLRKPNL